MIRAKIKKPDTYDYSDSYRRTCIETFDGDRYCDIPANDAIRLADIFENSPHERLNLTPEEFIFKLSYRFYTEWCLEDELKRRTDLNYEPKDHCRDYTNQGFCDFVNQETHHELIRRGYVWNEKAKQFRELTEEQYHQSREKVLEAIVKRAVELFSDWNGDYDPPSRKEETEGHTKYIYDDQKNLRCDLKDYITRASDSSSHSIQNAV